MEVKGNLAQAVVPWAKLLMASTTLVSVAFSTWIARQMRNPDIFQIARLMLVPLLAFVAFNIVFSPQYMIWLLPLAALGILGGAKWPMIVIAVATAVTPIFYPSREYGTGLNVGQTLVLFARNISLIVVWMALIVEFWKVVKNPAAETSV
jgi:hypothetical protein